jgi:hypothetical protein
LLLLLVLLLLLLLANKHADTQASASRFHTFLSSNSTAQSTGSDALSKSASRFWWDHEVQWQHKHQQYGRLNRQRTEQTAVNKNTKV